MPRTSGKSKTIDLLFKKQSILYFKIGISTPIEDRRWLAFTCAYLFELGIILVVFGVGVYIVLEFLSTVLRKSNLVL